MPQQLSSPMRQGTSFVPLDIGAQNDSMANITNPGQLQQHYLQVAQQQRPALPGQAQPSLSVGFTAEQYRTFQHRQLDAQLDSAFQGNQMSPQHMAQPAPVFPGLGISGMMPESNAVGMPGFGYLNPMTISSPQRGPLTPPMQSTSMCAPSDCLRAYPNIQADFFPRTPEESPFRRVIDFSPIRAPLELPKQMMDARRESNAQQASSGLQIIVTEPKSPAEVGSLSAASDAIIKTEPTAAFLPSPPNTMPMPGGRTFDAAFIPGPPLHSMPTLQFASPVDATPFDLFNELVECSPIPSPSMSCASPNKMDYSPIHRPMIMPMTMAPVMDLTHGFPLFNNDPSNFAPWDARAHSSSRTNSLDNDEAIHEDTGVSFEEVQAYIEEPDSSREGKWKCLYPGCEKLFGRKENIRSHVQTHLGDRQYKCFHCNKCFVRQHDLKRHAKIHSGVKPYPCRCGNTFARHDALTRHRQRGICDGGLPGIVKKSVKRGRPRKERLNSEERADKAMRTRARNGEKDSTPESGDSEDESCPSPQQSPMVYDNLDMSPLQHEQNVIFGDQSALFQQQSLQPLTSFSPSVFSTSPPTSPFSTGDKPSSTRHASISETASSPKTIVQAGKHDSVIGAPISDVVLFTKAESQVSEDIPDLSHSPPSGLGLDDIDFGSNFNSSELGQSISFLNQSEAGTMSLFDAQMLQNGMSDPSWDPEFLDMEPNKSFHLFDDQVLFAESP